MFSPNVRTVTMRDLAKHLSQTVHSLNKRNNIGNIIQIFNKFQLKLD